VHAVFYTPLNLKAYPFDKQSLLLHMMVPQARMGWSGDLVNLVPSLTGNAMFITKLGTDQLSSWSVDSVTMTPFSLPLCQQALSYFNTPSAPTDPSPLVPRNLEVLKAQGRAGSCGAVISALPDPTSSVFYRSALEANVPGEPVVVSGLMVQFHVTRFWRPYVITGRWLGGRDHAVIRRASALASIQLSCTLTFLPPT